MKSLGILGFILIIIYFVVKYKEFSFAQNNNLNNIEVKYIPIPSSVYDVLKPPNLKYQFRKLFDNNDIEYNNDFYNEKNVNI